MVFYFFMIFLLACLGATNIINFGKIFKNIRADNSFLKCPQCVGFWVGALMNVLFNAFLSVTLFPWTFVGCFIAGCVSSAFCYFMSVIINDDGLKLNHLHKNKD